MSDSGEMARVSEAVERIEVTVERMVECVMAPRVGLSARIEVLEERDRANLERVRRDDDQRIRDAELTHEMRFTHKVARWIGIIFGGALLLSLANLVISLARGVGK